MSNFQKKYIDLNGGTPRANNAANNKRAGRKKKLTARQGVRYVLSVIGTTFLTLFLIIIITVCIVAVALTVYITQFAESMYDVDLKGSVDLSLSSFVYAYDKNEGDYVRIMQISADENRVWVDIEEIPQHVIDAVIAMEDKRYFEHDGVDWSRTVSATLITLFDNDEMQGGSTVTQQLVRDITKDNNVNIGRKLREIFRALSLEKKYSKSDILESYLNRIAFDNTTYGIGSAAFHFFDKSIADVTIAEAAILAGVIRSPVSYSPYYSLSSTRKRQIDTLDKMYEQGLISYSEYDKALNEKVRFRKPVKGDSFGYTDERYNDYYGVQGDDDGGEDEDLYYANTDWEDMLGDPYKWYGDYEVTINWYVDAALKEVTDHLAELKGITKESARDLLKRGGYSIYLNVDTEMQDKIENVFRDWRIVRNPDFPYPAGTESKDTLQGAFVIMDYSGRVVALAGGVGDKPGNDCYNRATQSSRSIGSTVKPIAVYGPAVEYGKITYSTMLLDVAGKIDAPGETGETVSWPQNYEKNYGTGAYYNAWAAVMNSTNTISARTLSLVGVQNSYSFLQDKLGITTLDRSRNLNYSSLATGSLDVRLHELAAAYQIYGNGGIYYKPSLYSKIEDSNGQVVLRQDPVGVQAVGKDTAWIVNRMMRKVVNGGSGTGYLAAIDNIEVVGKTGTANDMANLLFCGLTPDYVGVVRIGFDDNREIKSQGVDRWRAIARIWSDVMKECIPTDEPRSFVPEPDVVEADYCTYTGLVAGPRCPSVNTGYYKKSDLENMCDDSKHNGVFLAEQMDRVPYYKNP
ncbi:MAG: penicillin-binding protein [Oscillospiraceae bacterium]|jgi:penicillin-binding protein 1A|nr:penicillin-binding protein [Oscillospiraceae bacterium]